MNTNQVTVFCLIVCCAVVIGCSRKPAPQKSAAATTSTQSSAPWVPPETVFEPFEQGELERYLALWPLLKQADDRIARLFVPGSASSLQSLDAWTPSAAANDLLAKEQLTLERFKKMAMRVWAAGIAAELQSMRERLETSQAAAKANMTEAGQKSMSGMMEGALARGLQAFAAYEKVPQGNVDAVKQYWNELLGKELPSSTESQPQPSHPAASAKSGPGKDD